MNNTVAVSIASNALILLGHDPIASFDEEGVGAKVASNFYETTLRAKLNEYDWNFARKSALLNKMSAAPAHRWKFAYQIPTDHIRTLTAYPHSDYDIVGDKIYSNTDNLELEYIYRIDESFFTAMFREALELYLAAKWAIPVTENATNAGVYDGLATVAFRKAKSIDAMEKPNRGSIEAQALPLRMRRAGGRGRRS